MKTGRGGWLLRMVVWVWAVLFTGLAIFIVASRVW